MEAKVQKIEPTEISGVAFIHFTSKYGELKLELPDSINYFKIDDEVLIRFVDTDKPEDDDKLFVSGYIHSNRKDDQNKSIVFISIGGLSFKLILNPDVKIPILKPRNEIHIGFK
ncbi:MAG: DNA-directed RNA polymerase subunit G [Candidatus Helarchaeota archaeon]